MSWVFTENGQPVYRASSFGGCLRSLVAARLDERPFPPSARLQAAMDASSEAERKALDAFIAERTKTATVIWQQKRVELPFEGASIVGHIDGLHQEEDTILEVKSFGATLFDAYDRGGLDALGSLGITYRWQAAIYGHALERPVRFLIFNKVSGELIVEPPVGAADLVPLGDIQNRLLAVEDFASRDEYPACDRGCTRGQAYSHVHLFDPVTIGNSNLTAKLDRYYSLDQTIKELTDQKKELADELKGSYPPGQYVAGGYKAVISKVNTGRFDTTALRKHHPDIYSEFYVPRTDIRLTVKEVGDGLGST